MIRFYSDKNSIETGVNTLANVVKVTLGPKGKNVMLYDGAGKAYLTKDGISVASAVSHEDPAVEGAIQILREASAKTADDAGDGTTTTLVLAQALYNEGLHALQSSKNLPTLRRELLDAADECTRMLKGKDFTREIPFDKTHLAYVARTSANNDEEIGELVAQAFIDAGKEGTVYFDTEDVIRTYTEVFEGSRFNFGLCSKEFYSDRTTQESNFEGANVLIFNNLIRDIKNIYSALKKTVESHRPLVIFANDFSELAMSQLYTNFVQGNLQVVPVKVTGYTGYRNDIYGDLSALTGAQVYDKMSEGIDPHLGYCDKITSTLTQTVVTVNEDLETLKIRINELRGAVSKEKDQLIKQQLDTRLTQLKGKIAVIHVGGVTEVEQKERYDRVEDAVCAVKASLEEGISVGGGATFIKLSKEIGVLSGIMKRALLEPYRQLCINSDVLAKIDSINGDIGYNFLTDKFENLYDAGVVDPTKVIRLCIENAVSVVLMLLSTEAVVYSE